MISNTNLLTLAEQRKGGLDEKNLEIASNSPKPMSQGECADGKE